MARATTMLRQRLSHQQPEPFMTCRGRARHRCSRESLAVGYLSPLPRCSYNPRRSPSEHCCFSRRATRPLLHHSGGTQSASDYQCGASQFPVKTKPILPRPRRMIYSQPKQQVTGTLARGAQLKVAGSHREAAFIGLIHRLDFLHRRHR